MFPVRLFLSFVFRGFDMTSSTLRSTKTLTEYIDVVDKMAELAIELKAAAKREKELRSAVLYAIGSDGRRAVTHNDCVRLLQAGERVSFELACQEADAVTYCQAHGIDVDERLALWLSPAKRRKYGLEETLPETIVSKKIEEIVIVD